MLGCCTQKLTQKDDITFSPAEGWEDIYIVRISLSFLVEDNESPRARMFDREIWMGKRRYPCRLSADLLCCRFAATARDSRVVIMYSPPSATPANSECSKDQATFSPQKCLDEILGSRKHNTRTNTESIGRERRMALLDIERQRRLTDKNNK